MNTIIKTMVWGKIVGKTLKVKDGREKKKEEQVGMNENERKNIERKIR